MRVQGLKNIIVRYKDQCGRMPRLFVQYLATYNNQNFAK